MTKKDLVGDLKVSLAAVQKPKQAEDPLEVRKKKAWQVPKSQDGYIGGAANEPHVHTYGADFHVKIGADRKNIVANGKLSAGVLKDARLALTEHARGNVLNAAIDRALLERKFDLDTY